MDRRVHLKVKIKSLAEEAKIIRSEKNKLKEKAYWMSVKWPEDAKKIRQQINSLVDHNRFVVADEARHSLLAYAILRGKPYSVVEQKFREHNAPDFGKVGNMANRFGASSKEIQNWVAEAKKYLGIVPKTVEKPKPKLSFVEKMVSSLSLT